MFGLVLTLSLLHICSSFSRVPVGDALAHPSQLALRDPCRSSSRLAASSSTDDDVNSGSSNGLFGRRTGNANKGFKKASPKTSDSTVSSEDVNGSSGGGKPVLEIPATTIKVAPLRFYLQLFMSGDIQNTPTKNSWLTQQGEQDGELQVYYQDGSAMLSIQLNDTSIAVTRKGTSPSLGYQLQESVLLHKLLDELNTVAFGSEEDENGNEKASDPSQRLLQLASSNVIEQARETLPARSAE